MKFKKSLLENITDGWELEDTESGLLDVIGDLERVAYELKNCMRGSYTKCATYKELSMYLKKRAEELDYEADALLALDESLIKDTELSEALSIEDAKRKLDQYPYQITVKAEDEEEFKKFLSSKNISFMIDDHLTADGKPDKNSTFHLKYPKHENLSEDLTELEDISHLIFDKRYGDESIDALDVCSLNEIDHYYKIVKNVHEAEMFNYHSDYWGHDKTYQEQNVELMNALSDYVGKMVGIWCDGEGIKGKLVGIAIDKQYNDIRHTKVVLDSIEELNESSKSKESYLKEDKKSLDPDEIWKILYYNEDCDCVLDTDKRYFIDEILSSSFKEAKNYDSVEYMAEDTYDHIINGSYPEISPEDWLKFIKQIAAEEGWFREVDEVSEIEEFTSLIEVIGPEYAGAPYPPFKRLCINESNIPYNMRFKSWDASVVDGGKNISLYWETQDEFELYDASKFIEEIERAINAMIKTYEFKNQFKLKIKAVCRDGEECGKVQKELSFNTIED